MTRMLLAAAFSLAALGAAAAPAQAQMSGGFGGSAAASSEFRRGLAHIGRDFASGANGCFTSAGRSRRGDMRSGRDGRGVIGCQGDVLFSYYGGEWAAYNNRSWDSDSYNDWWHDRPDRAYPAWVRRNQDCQRPWFAGDTLTC